MTKQEKIIQELDNLNLAHDAVSNQEAKWAIEDEMMEVLEDIETKELEKMEDFLQAKRGKTEGFNIDTLFIVQSVLAIREEGNL